MYEKKKTETAGIHGVQTNRCARSAAQFGGLYMAVHVSCMYVTSDAATP